MLYGYELLPGFWGMTMKEDQFIGGALMWVMGAMLRLGAMSIIFYMYARQEGLDEARSRARSIQKAREDARRAASGPPLGAPVN